MKSLVQIQTCKYLCFCTHLSMHRQVGEDIWHTPMCSLETPPSEGWEQRSSLAEESQNHLTRSLSIASVSQYYSYLS